MKKKKKVIKPKVRNLAIALFTLCVACSPPSRWQFKKLIRLEGCSPVGIAATSGGLWVSDAASNRLLKISYEGDVLEELKGFQRPMHLSLAGEDSVLVANYLTDEVVLLENGRRSAWPLNRQVNAPAGAAFNKGWLAVADFYNHRILLQKDSMTLSVGGQGHEPGRLYYPTDVDFSEGNLLVADAYNNRVQVFDLSGNFLKIIGENDNIRTATGIATDAKKLIATDFEGNRVLLYSPKGKLLEVLKDSLRNPSDVVIWKKQLFVANYANGSIAVFERS